MRLFTKRVSYDDARRLASVGLEHMGFFNPEQEVDLNFVADYMTQVVLDYDELIGKVEKSSMIKGALLMAGAIFVVNKLTDDKKEEE